MLKNPLTVADILEADWMSWYSGGINLLREVEMGEGSKFLFQMRNF